MDKKIFFFLISLSALLYSSAVAQQHRPEQTRDPAAREKIRAAHTAYITQQLQLTTAEAEAFWPVYREYVEKRRKIHQKLRASRKAEADGKVVLERDLAIKQQELDLEKVYIRKFQEIIPPEKLIKLRPAESDFRKLILRQIQKQRRD